MTSGQLELLTDLSAQLTKATILAGTLADSFDQPNLVTAVLGIVEAELRMLGQHVIAAGASETTTDQYADRPDLRSDWCHDCGRQTDHMIVRGDSLCVFCHTVAYAPLTVVNGGAC